LLLASLYVVFDLKHSKARQDKVRQDGKVPTLLGQEMADSWKPDRPFLLRANSLVKLSGEGAMISFSFTAYPPDTNGFQTSLTAASC
jgi:hypothetical protein